MLEILIYYILVSSLLTKISKSVHGDMQYSNYVGCYNICQESQMHVAMLKHRVMKEK